MGKPHIHAEFIKVWLSGGNVEFRNSFDKVWRPVIEDHSWQYSTEYRIKPEPQYPVTQVSAEVLSKIYRDHPSQSCAQAVIAIANFAILRAIQDGDVILPNKD